MLCHTKEEDFHAGNVAYGGSVTSPEEVCSVILVYIYIYLFFSLF